ncbi:filamentous hemagglutinin N-terminal domain-containing protein [Xenorhabdus bovienii]|uniref:filamentous hemagglutinin N-terminal domain-containing protein n=1 Tax=Xenorhabdus bovienii TaxID=40576 RepID=UPI00237C5E19|nr:filamentous hemagglutinin N-terminal domain-containing protein [Xenorhabdus bovienii]MDE1481091.1 filamentous hemagglutinin N-terminal domain-containing protein [Xenorhabdus bovienii]MDE9430925.1 filamentous hemagglutinin N-terminal domain-containing protein [Xenorhabdus bovienii]MDE9440366.1 filamentous hemagglutinin N-terminal domain-containing protein [Xenorhabdus bovienii]MDE9488569.1 filamentous hemagglutinin N-terminal domain-containing protein [Xenorhabdus bovienii]MDE9504949.1 filam
MTIFKNSISFVKLTSCSLVCLFFSINSAFAGGIIPNDSNTQVKNINNVPVVNIATPTLSGMSRNTYKEFNVGEQGLVLNNSLTQITSELAGQLDKNPNLKNRSAELIVNEVVGGNQSQLLGALEVVGDKAKVIIANPNGVMLNGVSFINNNEFTITTGKPTFNKKDLLTLEVVKGQITIDEKGLELKTGRDNNLKGVSLMSRALEVNGIIKAPIIVAMAGTMSAHMKDPSLTRLIAGEGAKPEFSINVKDLGGMYADARIRLTSSEDGVGVNLRNLKGPEIHASSKGGNMYVTTNGSEDMKNIHFYGDGTKTKIFIDGIPY